ncbi:MAG TPA: thiamine pyrophosphate-dependent enzyme, partial [Gemmatimonadales bacterium]|nr:thiamine pyrophosphate-dependent enzyme [Gemmatimonadales bacterium]
HSMSDPIHGHYRTKEEVEEQRKRDPIHTWADQLKAAKLIDDAGIKAMEDEVMAEVMDALKFAEESPDPEPGELWTDVYAGSR